MLIDLDQLFSKDTFKSKHGSLLTFRARPVHVGVGLKSEGEVRPLAVTLLLGLCGGTSGLSQLPQRRISILDT